MMFPEAIVKGATKIANARIHRDNPMISNAVEEWQAKAILEATYDLVKEWNERTD